MAGRFMEITAVETPPESVEADLLVLPIMDPPRLSGPASRLDGILGGRLEHLIEDREIKGGIGQLALTHTAGELGAHRVAVAGVGKPAGVDGDSLRTAAARAAQRAIGLRGGTVAWVLDPDLPLDSGRPGAGDRRRHDPRVIQRGRLEDRRRGTAQHRAAAHLR